MRKLYALMAAFILASAVFVAGCEKKEAPKATEQPATAPAPEVSPAAPAPAEPAKK